MTTIARSPLDSGRTALHEEAHEVAPGFDIERVRADFPILREKVRGHQLVYLDNAATSQKPKVVMDAIVRYYEHDNANIHRGVHYLSERATEEFEEARKSVQTFLHAARPSEIVFVRGATEAINLVAQTYGRVHVGAGDEVLIIPILFPGKCCVRKSGRHSALRRSMTRASWFSRNSKSCSAPKQRSSLLATSRMRWVP